MKKRWLKACTSVLSLALCMSLLLNGSVVYATEAVSSSDILMMIEDNELAEEDMQVNEQEINNEGLDYILGRPMTDEERQEQYDLMDFFLQNAGAIEPDEPQGDITLPEDYPMVMSALPSAYDSRDVNGVSYVTSVKTQNPYGTCWAFTSIACAESSLIRKGLADTSIDLSESHLAYFSNFGAPDILGNDYQDNLYHTGDYLNVGGNTDIAALALRNWKGAVTEEYAPYEDASSGFDRTTEIAYNQSVARLEGYYKIAFSDRDAVKAAIMEYGSVGIMYYASSTYLKADTAAYYCYSDIGVNHAVTVVGWDDDYSVDNFKKAPESNGAWLVKNSWGTSWGDEGYFWLSYEDASVHSTVTAFDMVLVDNYDNNYQYDHGQSTIYWSATQVASVYEAKANGDKQEVLKAVGIDCSYESNVNYTIQIYKNLTDPTDPTSGTAMLSEPQPGTMVLAGYYTVPLDEPVTLDAGDFYSIVVTLQKDGTNQVFYPMERDYTAARMSVASAEPQQSFYYWNSWIDTSDTSALKYDGNVRLKAFTDNADSGATSVRCSGITLNKTTAKLVGNEDTLTLIANVAPSNATNQAVGWYSSDTSVAMVDANGVVTVVDEGIAEITAKTCNGGYTASCTVEVEIPVETISYSHECYGSGNDKWLYIGEDYNMYNLSVLPSNAGDKTLTWTTSDKDIARVDSNGVITPITPGVVTITATAKSGVSTSTTYDVRLRPGGYIGHVNTELMSFDLKQADNGGYYLTGEIVVVEWVDGESTVPQKAPTMKFQSTDGTEEIDVFVTPTGTNTYYFDRFIDGLSEDKEYVFEITSGDANNYSIYRSMNVLLATSPRLVSLRNLGKVGEQKISYYQADNGELRLYRRTQEYVGNINSELLKTELVTGPNGNYVSGQIVVVEWEDGISTVPFESPIMYFKSTDGKESLPVFVTATGTNTYYFDRSLGDLDTTKEYVFTIESGDELNVSPYKSMTVTTAAMTNKTGTLWESSTQYVKYRTDADTGELRVYGVNK